MSKRLTFFILLMIIVCTIFNSVKAQQWSAFGSGVTWQVNSIVRFNNNLWVASDYPCYFDGSNWITVANGLIYPLGVGVFYTLAVFNNTLFGGGFFTVLTPENNWYNNVARLHNGSWTTCGNGLGDDGCGIDGEVYYLIEYNGNLYAGGNFGSAGGDPLSPQEVGYIARFDGSLWHPVGSGVNDKITDMAVYDNKLVVSGYFTEAGGIPANHVSCWDGSTWSALGSGTDGKVTALAVHDGCLYIGGLFDNAGGSPAKNIAKWDGMKWSSVGDGLMAQVYTLASYRGKLYAGGDGIVKRYFDTPPYSIIHNIMCWDGAKWDSLGQGPDGPVNFLLSDTLGLVVGGRFTKVGELSAQNIALFNSQSGVEYNETMKPGNFSLEQNYPNPFNPITKIRFTIPERSFVSLRIYDALGKAITTIVNKELVAGSYEYQWNAEKLSSGIYFYNLQAGKFTETKRLLLIK